MSDDVEIFEEFHVENAASLQPIYLVEQHLTRFLESSKKGRSKDASGVDALTAGKLADRLLFNSIYFSIFPYTENPEFKKSFASGGGKADPSESAASPANSAIPATPASDVAGLLQEEKREYAKKRKEVWDALFAMKPISDTNSFSVNQMNPDAARSKFALYFPPRSRSVQRKEKLLGCFDREMQKQTDSRVKLELDRIRKEVASEMELYDGMREECERAGERAASLRLGFYHELLPLWIVRQEVCGPASWNLFGLDFWDCGSSRDTIAYCADSPLDCLLQDLLKSFRQNQNFDDSMMSDYSTCVMAAYESYRETHDVWSEAEREAIAGLSLVELRDKVKSDEIELPAWVESKANLIWDVVVCPLFGLGHMLPPLEPGEESEGTKTSSVSLSFSDLGAALAKGAGQVLVEQLQSEVCKESRPERTLDLCAGSSAEGLVMMLGSAHDPTYWDALVLKTDAALGEFFAFDASPLRTSLKAAAIAFFSPTRKANIRASASGAGWDALSEEKREAWVGGAAFLEKLDGELGCYFDRHPASLEKGRAKPGDADAYGTVDSAVERACREFAKSVSSYGVGIKEDLTAYMLGALDGFFEGELGERAGQASDHEAFAHSLVSQCIFGALDEFFEDRDASWSPSKVVMRTCLEQSLAAWRETERRSIGHTCLQEAVSRAVASCVKQEESVFCATGPGGLPEKGKVVAANSRRHFAFTVEGDRLMMRDLGSKNGSIVIRRETGEAYLFEAAPKHADDRRAEGEKLAKEYGCEKTIVVERGDSLQACRGDLVLLGSYSLFRVG